MATVVTAYDGTELTGANAETTDGGIWDKLGVSQSPTAETDFFYEGIQAISNKVSNATGGVDFNPTSALDMETVARVAVAIIGCATPSLIDHTVAKGVAYYIGTGASGTNYYEYNIFGSGKNYPVKGGFTVIAIDPNVAGYRDATTGSAPDLTVVDYFGLYMDIAVAVNVSNVVHDTLSWVAYGGGITLTRGDAGSTEGVFQDFIDFDEGITTNRRGIISEAEGVLIVTGMMNIGESGTATEFTDSAKTVVYPDGRVDTGFFGITLNIENASTIISLTSCTFISNGNITSGDSRALMKVVGTSGTLTVDGCVFVNHDSPTLTSKPDYLSSKFLNNDTITVGTTTFTGCTFQDAIDAAVLMSSVSHGLTGGEFKDNVVGIEFDTAGTFPLADVGFSGNTTADVRNSVEASQLTTATIGGTNHKIGDATIVAAGQSFLGTATVLSRIIFRLRAVASPTGNAVCKLYASTGSDPTRTPTGAALATSNLVDVSTFGAYADVPFEFEDEFTMSAVTYFAVIEYVGDVTNHIEADANATGATYASNNFASNTGSWAAIDDDADFSVNTGGIVKITATGSTPGSLTVENTATVKGATIIVASKNLTFTGLIAGTEIRCYTGVTTDVENAIEIGGVESSGTSFSFGHQSGGVAGYIIIHSVVQGSITLDPFTYSTSDQSIPIDQDVDRNYNNP